jgi:hypothetical protein
MNIFFLHTDPAVSAVCQVNKHIVKMPLETAQIGCTPKSPLYSVGTVLKITL